MGSGYKLHLIVDAVYELPVMFSVTKASEPDINEGHRLLEQMEKRQPEILEEAEVLTADRGYDNTKLITQCWDTYQIKPVIDIRNMWQDGDKTRVLRDFANVTYNHKGQVYGYCRVTGKVREMVCGGFEKDRDTLKKPCSAQ